MAALAAFVLASPALGQGGVSEWPREFKTPKGNTIVMYQPQAETFQGDRATGRAAVSFQKKGEAAPKFGVIFFSARVSVDRDTRLVSVLDMKVSRVRFPGIKPEGEKKFTDNLEAEVPKWDLVFSYDRLLENVKVAQREKKSAEGLRHDPPRIVFAEEPSVLLSYDGEPVFREVEGAPVKVAVNTSLLVVNDARSGRYYLAGGKKWWYEASNPLGPWRTVGGPPADIAEFAAKAQAEQKKEDKDQLEDDGTEGAAPPRVVVATEPTELVVTEGRPALKPVTGTDGNLLAVDNTEADVLFDVTKQDYYVLLSGRWFRSKSLSGGAWTYVAPDALPDSFAKIPPDSDSGDVRAAVAGTDEAEDAVLDAQIPQTTAVKRAEAALEVQWDGEPKFIPIDGSATSYAANASTSVLRIRGRYYACENAVWFVSDSPDGPWVVADSVPSDDIDAIPPSAPVYNVKYVRVYDATPDAVYFGYTPGYTGVYPWHGTVVWGTGWYYRPWAGPVYWWPRPYTWGLCAHYNPWTGWGFGYSWSYPFFSVSFGWGGWFRPSGWYRPPYHGGWGGGWHRPGGWGWYGPGGYRPPAVIAGHYWGSHGGGSWNRPLPNPRPGAVRPAVRPIPGVRPGIGFRPPSKDIRPPAQTNIYNRLPARSRDVPRVPSTFDRPRPSGSKPNNVYADPSGEVYRRTKEGQWQQRESGRWKPSDGGATARPGGSGPSTRPPAVQPPSMTTRPSPGVSRPAPRPAPRPELERDFSARQRGDERVRERSRDSGIRQQSVSRPAPQAAPQARPAPQAAPQARPASPPSGERRSGGDRKKN